MPTRTFFSGRPATTPNHQDSLSTCGIVMSGYMDRTVGGCGPASVDGQVDDRENYGKIVSAAAPRLMQLVVKYNF